MCWNIIKCMKSECDHFHELPDRPVRVLVLVRAKDTGQEPEKKREKE